MAAWTAEQVMARQARRRRLAKRLASKRRKKVSLREYRQLAQFLACGGAFVLLVAAKLLSSDHAEPLRAKLSEAMGRNMDVQAVFSTVGRTFAGEGDAAGAAERIYQAVFQPGGLSLPTESDTETEESADSGTASEPGAAPYRWTGALPKGTALDTLREYQSGGILTSDDPGAESEPVTAPAESAPETESDTDPVPGDDTANAVPLILYSGQNLPEHVSMEQVILNFDYTAPAQGTFASGFGYREHPVDGETKFHYGIDLAADEGTEIVCFADGIVSAVGESTSYGRYCMVSHPGGVTSIYAHCKRISAASGQVVHLGEKIAEIGATGMTTGPHLHFELQQNGVYLNPVYYVV